ncbi:hypothetical protein GCM10009846_20960 [Agrococcus versicolor]|uniref:Tetratricopeptide repeat protein n=1 Tax=Agrococcus versicolor TaxID=501482 RepID=A0ABN3AU32_9MICO
MTDDARRRMRLILMLVLAPITIAGLVLAGKLVSVNAFADASQNAYERRAYQEAEVQARGLQWWNVLEPWKAPYDVGVALGMRGELEEARTLLEESLALHGEDGSNEHCIILTSIVYVVEKQGDVAREADDTQTANGLYQEALGIIEAAPEGCYADPTPIQADTGEQLEQSVPRIEEKIEDESGGGGEGEPEESEGEPEEDPEQPPTQQEQLEEQNQDAQEQQQQQDEYNQQGGEEPGGGGGVEQPW